ncbi:MAG: FHA domain-containing protein [Planctomycetota bacterium]
MNQTEGQGTPEDDTHRTVLLKSRPGPFLDLLSEDRGQVRLEVIGGPMDGLRKNVAGDSLSIGRSGDNDLVLPLDLRVSGHHARIVAEGPGYSIEDLQSRNGTFLGKKRVLRRAPIRPGTLFVVGATCIEFMPQ